MHYFVYFILFIIIALIFFIIVLIYSFPRYFLGLIAVIIIGRLVYKIIEQNKEEIKRKEREIERENKDQEEKEKRLRMEEALTQAFNEGKDVCWKCETIKPKRCDGCHICISCWRNRSDRYNNLCGRCGQEEAARECAYAERQGKRVCWDCLTVEPIWCSSCGNCTVCHGLAGEDLCYICDDDD